MLSTCRVPLQLVTGRKRSHSNSNQLTDCDEVIVESALRSLKALSSSLHRVGQKNGATDRDHSKSADINVSQGNVATYARYVGIFNMLLTANLPRNLPVKKIVNRLRFDRIMVMSQWPRFLAHPVD